MNLYFRQLSLRTTFCLYVGDADPKKSISISTFFTMKSFVEVCPTNIVV